MIGFTRTSYPQRTAAPNSSVVAAPFSAYGGSGAAWEQAWQKAYDEEMMRARPQTGFSIELSPTGKDYNPLTALPVLDARKQQLTQIFDQQFGTADHTDPNVATARRDFVNWMMSPYSGDKLNPTTQYIANRNDFGMGFGDNLSTVSTAGGNLSHRITSPDYMPRYVPDVARLNTEKEQLAPLAEQQIRQQQAYDQMQGGWQLNGVMSPDYANAGFNQVTGSSNAYAGPSQSDLIGLETDWMQGVYDPSTQRATGAYTPTNYSNNRGW